MLRFRRRGGRIGSLQASCRLLRPILVLALISGTIVAAATVDDLTLGEAHYMTGNLTEAADRLSAAAGSGDPLKVQRALYLLGRISLLTGDFRQAKEYFERAADVKGGNGSSRWMALAGIGDTLYASGRYEEAIRRYRIALSELGSGAEGAVIRLRMALCEHGLGRGEEARRKLRDALSGIPVLSGWVGREEEFYHSLTMAGIEYPERQEERIFVLVGPLKGDFRTDDVIGPDIPVRELRVKGRTFLEYGPLADPVEAMILSERIRNRLATPAEVVTR